MAIQYHVSHFLISKGFKECVSYYFLITPIRYLCKINNSFTLQYNLGDIYEILLIA